MIFERSQEQEELIATEKVEIDWLKSRDEVVPVQPPIDIYTGEDVCRHFYCTNTASWHPSLVQQNQHDSY